MAAEKNNSTTENSKLIAHPTFTPTWGTILEVPPKPHPRPAKRTTLTKSKYDSSNLNDTKPVYKRERKKSCTELLCELTRLKTQQKYLECNQVKLKCENFQDIVDDAVDLKPNISKSSSLSSLASASPTSSLSSSSFGCKLSPATARLIQEIEQLKIDLNAKLHEYRSQTKIDVKDLRVLVESIRDDVTKEERLRLFSLPVIRERIIGINKRLENLRRMNACQMEKLLKDLPALENGLKFHLK